MPKNSPALLKNQIVFSLNKRNELQRRFRHLKELQIQRQHKVFFYKSLNFNRFFADHCIFLLRKNVFYYCYFCCGSCSSYFIILSIFYQNKKKMQRSSYNQYMKIQYFHNKCPSSLTLKNLQTLY